MILEALDVVVKQDVRGRANLMDEQAELTRLPLAGHAMAFDDEMSSRTAACEEKERGAEQDGERWEGEGAEEFHAPPTMQARRHERMAGIWLRLKGSGEVPLSDI